MASATGNPLVSVICVCHDQAAFVVEALQSILNQTYEPIEIIVTDDASTDESLKVIEAFKNKTERDIEIVAHSANLGHCRVFNHAFNLSSGKFVIDLAADDILEPNRVTEGVSSLMKHGPSYGVHFGDATLIDKHSSILKYHKTQDFFNEGSVPEGNLYEVILRKYFICPPTMMYTRAVIKTLQGYDETLYYEDFDFWVRSSRNFNYCYTPKLIAQKRILKSSKSSTQYKLGSKMIKSTLKVCVKAYFLNKDLSEFEALLVRVKYELRQALRTWDIRSIRGFINLYFKNINMIKQFRKNLPEA